MTEMVLSFGSTDPEKVSGTPEFRLAPDAGERIVAVLGKAHSDTGNWNN